MPLMPSYMAGMEANGWETVGVRHKTKYETMGMLLMLMTQLGMGIVAPTNRPGLPIGNKLMHG